MEKLEALEQLQSHIEGWEVRGQAGEPWAEGAGPPLQCRPQPGTYVWPALCLLTSDLADFQ